MTQQPSTHELLLQVAGHESSDLRWTQDLADRAIPGHDGAAGPTQQAIAEKAIAEQETATATEKAKLREAQLLAEVQAPSRAHAEQVRIQAEADKDKAIKEAEARAEATRIQAQAEADRIAQIGAAEAKAIEARAEATKKLTGAAKGQMVLELLPAIIREVASPMGKIEGMTVISTDGASELTKTMGSVLAQAGGIMGSLGIDLGSMLNNKDEDDKVAFPAPPVVPSSVPTDGDF